VITDILVFPIGNCLARVHGDSHSMAYVAFVVAAKDNRHPAGVMVSGALTHTCGNPLACQQWNHSWTSLIHRLHHSLKHRHIFLTNWNRFRGFRTEGDAALRCVLTQIAVTRNYLQLQCNRLVRFICESVILFSFVTIIILKSLVRSCA